MHKLIVPAGIYSADQRQQDPALLALAELLTVEQASQSIVSSELYCSEQ